MYRDLVLFLSTNSSAVFGLIGAIGGAVLSFFASFLLKKRDFNLQMWGKLFDRRIAAHEKVISLAVDMRVMVTLGGIDENKEIRRTPQILLSKDVFEGWFARFTQLTSEGTSWLTIETKREVNFIQDYLATLHMHLAYVADDNYPHVGTIIRQDFVDLSASLEKKAFSFFQHGILELKLDSLDQHHKYKLPETEKRLQATALMRDMSKIRSDKRN